jgi:hypothetical protein
MHDFPCGVDIAGQDHGRGPARQFEQLEACVHENRNEDREQKRRVEPREPRREELSQVKHAVSRSIGLDRMRDEEAAQNEEYDDRIVAGIIRNTVLPGPEAPNAQPADLNDVREEHDEGRDAPNRSQILEFLTFAHLRPVSPGLEASAPRLP